MFGLVTNAQLLSALNAIAAVQSKQTATLTVLSTQQTALSAQQAAQSTQLVGLFAQQTAQAAQLAALLTQQGVQNTLLSSILADVLAILKLVTPVPSKASKIMLALPTVTKKGIVVMPVLNLLNDTVATAPILTEDSVGAVEPYPTGDVFSAVSSNPASLTAAIVVVSPTQSNLVLTPLVQVSPGLTVTVTDTAGLPPEIWTVNIVDDTVDTQIATGTFTTTPQPVPTATGP
jgi:hypothetical protein